MKHTQRALPGACAIVVFALLGGCSEWHPLASRNSAPSAAAQPNAIPASGGGAAEPTSTLTADPFDTPAATSLAEAAKATGNAGDSGHDMTAMKSEVPPASGAAHDHATAEHSSARVARPTPKTAAVIYTCPMHPEVTSTKPGKCPKCGMTLVPKKKQ